MITLSINGKGKVDALRGVSIKSSVYTFWNRLLDRVRKSDNYIEREKQKKYESIYTEKIRPNDHYNFV